MGWIDNMNGPTGLLVGAGKGVIRTMLCNPDYLADCIPVDLVVNGLILTAWETGTAKKSKAPLVVNLTMSVSICKFIKILKCFSFSYTKKNFVTNFFLKSTK